MAADIYTITSYIVASLLLITGFVQLITKRTFLYSSKSFSQASAKSKKTFSVISGVISIITALAISAYAFFAIPYLVQNGFMGTHHYFGDLVILLIVWVVLAFVDKKVLK